MYKIIYLEKALKQLSKIKDTKTRAQINKGIKQLAYFPKCPNVKALTNYHYSYRLRVGRFRVFFTVLNGEVDIIHIEEVKKRDDNTY
jgi:mRNA interferase RelE/StbE